MFPVLGLVFVLLIVVWLAVNLWKTPVDFFNVFLIGLTIGCVYALIALGYTLVYGILQLINFAHGDVFALSGLFATTIITGLLGLTAATSAIGVVGGLALTFLIAMVFGAGINAGIEFVAYRRLRNAPRLSVLITAVGMSFILQNVGQAFYGANYISVDKLIPHTAVFTFRGVHYEWDALFVILMTIPVLIILSWLVKSTRQGKAMRATSQDPAGRRDHGHQRQPDDHVHVRRSPARSRASARRSSWSSSTSATTRGSRSA